MSLKAIILTMLVSFAISFAVMWRGRTEEQPIFPTRSDIEPQFARPVAAPGRPAGHIAPSPTNVPRITPTTPPKALSDPDDSGAQANTELPIYVGFRRVAERNNATEGVLINQSEKALTIAVTVVHSHTKQTSHGYLDVASQGRTTFGVDDGLDLHPADEITLHSPPYPDLVRHVR